MFNTGVEAIKTKNYVLFPFDFFYFNKILRTL